MEANDPKGETLFTFIYLFLHRLDLQVLVEVLTRPSRRV